MKIYSVFDPVFASYGKVIDGYDFSEILEKLEETPLPEAGICYVPGNPVLEATPAAKELAVNFFGGMPIQIGYCNGSNQMLNCLEYHRNSEIDLADTDMILLLGQEAEIVNGKFDTARVRAFLVPKGTAVELFAPSLHYAPCGYRFRCLVALPRGTNTGKPAIKVKNQEDQMLWACNKWLLCHPEAEEAGKGAYIGLTGENLVVRDLI